MLPYTPLHHLLMAAVARPIVCTSGNLSEEPMAITIEDAMARLGPIADVLLTHNRPIVRPVDDSIVRFGPDGMQVLRRARGFAPLPIELRDRSPRRADDSGRRRASEEHRGAAARPTGGGRRRVGQAYAVPPSGTEKCGGTALRLVHPTQPAQVVMSAHVGDLDSSAGRGGVSAGGR